MVFTDFVSDSEVELQGLSIMEAMACGLPVILASSIAIPELVKDGINVTDASKKILLLAENKKLREKMSLNSLRLIREHGLNATLAKFEEIYYECVYEVSKTYKC